MAAVGEVEGRGAARQHLGDGRRGTPPGRPVPGGRPGARFSFLCQACCVFKSTFHVNGPKVVFVSGNFRVIRLTLI